MVTLVTCQTEIADLREDQHEPRQKMALSCLSKTLSICREINEKASIPQIEVRAPPLTTSALTYRPLSPLHLTPDKGVRETFLNYEWKAYFKRFRIKKSSKPSS